MRDLRITSSRLAVVTRALAAVLEGVFSIRTKDSVVSLNGIQDMNDGWPILIRLFPGLAVVAND